MTFQKPKQH
ncbi:hypothetical protein D049_4300A, partial [Vibrio parahaemolyticus VPTS-2010]